MKLCNSKKVESGAKTVPAHRMEVFWRGISNTDLYETDKEVQNLIDWVCLSEQIKTNNNTIRSLTGEYKKIEPACREGVRAQLERMKELCKERNGLYEKQNNLKEQKQKIEKSLE